MQLKMEEKKKRKFNKQDIRTRLEKESKFIGNLMSLISIPCHDDELQDDVYVGSKIPTREEAKSIHRAKTFQELSNRLKKLQGTKDFSVKNKLLKKSLARRLKKKTKKEERNSKKKQSKIKKGVDGGPKIVRDTPEAPVKKEVVKPTKPVFNSQGKMVFSKFDFSQSGVPEDKRKGERDPKRILENLQKQKETVKELREAGEKDKANVMMEKISWKNALAKAEGQKIKDDPILLKKTVKKMEQKKKQSSKKWDSRLEGVQKAKDDKQKKRETNIQKRKQDMKKKVIKKATKKGRMIP